MICNSPSSRSVKKKTIPGRVLTGMVLFLYRNSDVTENAVSESFQL